MAERTAIEWCDATFNPWIGCTRVSPACDHCYAAVSTPARTRGIEWGPGKPRERTSLGNWRQIDRWNRDEFMQCANCKWRGDQNAWRGLHASRCCAQPMLEPARRRVFCASLADWLDNEVPIEWFVDLLDLIRRTPNLDWLLLTKRIGNWSPRLVEAAGVARAQPFGTHHDSLAEWIGAWLRHDAPGNAWLGATVVNQAEADRDAPKLLQVPARVRFLSIEPMLGPISLEALPSISGIGRHLDALSNAGVDESADIATKLDWVIAGGESGLKARPMHPDWVRSLRDQCAAAGVPFLFKQWGEWAETETYFDSDLQRRVLPDGSTYRVERLAEFDSTAVLRRVGKKSAGNMLDGRQHLEFPV